MERSIEAEIPVYKKQTAHPVWRTAKQILLVVFVEELRI